MIMRTIISTFNKDVRARDPVPEALRSAQLTVGIIVTVTLLLRSGSNWASKDGQLLDTDPTFPGGWGCIWLRELAPGSQGRCLHWALRFLLNPTNTIRVQAS